MSYIEKLTTIVDVQLYSRHHALALVAHSARSIPEVGGAGCSERSFSIELHRLGPENVAVIPYHLWLYGVAAYRGFRRYCIVWRCIRDLGEWPS